MFVYALLCIVHVACLLSVDLCHLRPPTHQPLTNPSSFSQTYVPQSFWSRIRDLVVAYTPLALWIDAVALLVSLVSSRRTLDVLCVPNPNEERRWRRWLASSWARDSFFFLQIAVIALVFGAMVISMLILALGAVVIAVVIAFQAPCGLGLDQFDGVCVSLSQFGLQDVYCGNELSQFCRRWQAVDSTEIIVGAFMLHFAQVVFIVGSSNNFVRYRHVILKHRSRFLSSTSGTSRHPSEFPLTPQSSDHDIANGTASAPAPLHLRSISNLTAHSEGPASPQAASNHHDHAYEQPSTPSAAARAHVHVGPLTENERKLAATAEYTDSDSDDSSLSESRRKPSGSSRSRRPRVSNPPMASPQQPIAIASSQLSSGTRRTIRRPVPAPLPESPRLTVVNVDNTVTLPSSQHPAPAPIRNP